MKRARDDCDDLLVSWHTRDGRVTSTWPRSFLAKHSGFFSGLFRSHDSENLSGHVNIRLSYPKEIVELLFKHLDGEQISATGRQEAVLKEAIDFLILEPPFDVVDNQGFEKSFCAWCSKEADNSICLAKRWFMVESNGINRQQCPICCELIQFCECDHVSFQNPHCDDFRWVRAFKYNLDIGDSVQSQAF